MDDDSKDFRQLIFHKFRIYLLIASQESRDFHKALFSAISNYLFLRLTNMDTKILVKNTLPSAQQLWADQVKNNWKNTIRVIYSENMKNRTHIKTQYSFYMF
jgi:hypothetical protein